MEIVKTIVTRGPNYWSNYRKNLIILTLDLQEFSEIYTNQIPQFNIQLKKLLPTLIEHHCSPGVKGGFFQRLDEGTLLGHVLEHIALEIQTLGGMECGYGRVRETSQKGIYNVVFSYQIESAGLYAAKVAFNIIQTLASQQTYTLLSTNIKMLRDIYSNESFGPSTKAILEEAANRNIPYTKINNSLIMLGYGKNQKIISFTLGNHTSGIGIDIASDKDVTKQILHSEYIPVPKGLVVTTINELIDAIEKIGFPLVLKPRYGNHGKGITTNIVSVAKAHQAFAFAHQISKSVVAEKYIEGFDYRFLLINYKVVAVAKRTAPFIIGDGKKRIIELIDDINNHPHRGLYHENILTKIQLDEITLKIIKEQSLSLQSVLAKNQILYLKQTANISTGGTAEDVTDLVHPYNVFLAERVARLINLDVCGIDVIAKDIKVPLKKSNGAIIEVNAAPGFRMHLSPQAGMKRNVAKAFIDLHYPNNQPSRIPIVSVTGTNGKTTVVRLISYLAKKENHNVGTCTTEGIEIRGTEIYHGDCSGPKSANVVLRDPTIDFAVLECARGGILRSGLAFDKCDISIITNISEDHLGIGGIHTLEELKRVKSVVAYSTFKEGYCILNAEDDLVYSLKEELECNIALFSTNKNERIIKQIHSGSLACFIEDDIVYLADRNEINRIAHVKEFPLTLNGISHCMKQNLLPAILTAWISKFDFALAISNLKSFTPSAENLPGRMNLFNFQHCKVMVDYAHNEKAYIELKKYLASINASKKIGIIAGTGDRRAEDIIKTGYYAAEIFDEIIIRQDKDLRGRTPDEITKLLIDGIHSVNSHKIIRIIPNEFEAIQHALATAVPGTFIWYFPDNILNSIKFIKKNPELIMQE